MGDVVKRLRLFEETQERRLEKAKYEKQKLIERLEKERAEELKRAREEALKEKEKIISDAIKKARLEAKSIKKEYEERTKTIEKKSSRNLEKAINKCIPILFGG